jgi:hypothetical protein
MRAWDAFLAGLQAGLIGVLWMLAWLGISSMLERRGFWMAENLLASAFYGSAALRGGFSGSTLSGLALYILMYSVLGALFAWALHLYAKPTGLPRLTLILAAVACGLGWYWLTFQMLWKNWIPLAAILHSRSGTVLGHVLYGTLIARFPAYLPRAAHCDEPAATHDVLNLPGTGMAAPAGDVPQEEP